jgi:hypothetical protein
MLLRVIYERVARTTLQPVGVSNAMLSRAAVSARLQECLRPASWRRTPADVFLSEILGFRTLSIVQVLKDKTKEEHDFSETGSVSVFRWGKKLLCGVP